MPKVRLEELAEGGFINDSTGKETLKARKKGFRLEEPPKKPKGNPALKRFQ